VSTSKIFFTAMAVLPGEYLVRISISRMSLSSYVASDIKCVIISTRRRKRGFQQREEREECFQLKENLTFSEVASGFKALSKILYRLSPNERLLDQHPVDTVRPTA